MEHEIPWVSLSPNMTKETEGLSTRGLTSQTVPAIYLIKHNFFYTSPAGITHLTQSNSTMHKLHVLMYVLKEFSVILKPSHQGVCESNLTIETQETEINQPRGRQTKAIHLDYEHIYC